MILTEKWSDFRENLNRLIKQGLEIHKSNSRIRTEDELNELKAQSKIWNDEVFKYLNESFDDENNEFATGFHRAQSNGYHIHSNQKHVHDYIKEELQKLNSKAKTLEYYLKLIGISDVIIKPKEIDIEARMNFETDEILELLLEKLYELYDDYYHSVLSILEGNGIQLKRHGEERELAKTLEDHGYVKLTHARDINAQLTIEGKRYVEQKRKIHTTDYSKISQTEEELNNKIDDIILGLKKLGYGQEILFDELEELKNLYPKLNKKNWGQVLKGKLIDLGLAQILSPETMNTIFKELTDQVLKLN